MPTTRTLVHVRFGEYLGLNKYFLYEGLGAQVYNRLEGTWTLRKFIHEATLTLPLVEPGAGEGGGGGEGGLKLQVGMFPHILTVLSRDSYLTP